MIDVSQAVAYFIARAAQGFWPVLNQGTPAILCSFFWLYIAAAGADPWSLDADEKTTREVPAKVSVDFGGRRSTYVQKGRMSGLAEEES